MRQIKALVTMPFRYHLFVGFLIRMVLILYGNHHDSHYEVQYTDVDYKVFTDAARHVANGESPYKRHTYRYSPIIAYLLLPNIYLVKEFGKVLFSFFDILLTIALKFLVEEHLKKSKQSTVVSKLCAMFWLYNPLSIGISTRGNADSVPCFIVIMSLCFLQTNIIKGVFKYILSGIFLGTSIHLRLYPLVFSFPMFLSLGNYRINRNTSIKDGLVSLIPNKNQIFLTVSCVLTLFTLTYSMHLLYGYEFLFETYIYHFFRKDIRHNFSILFYYSYLTMDNFGFDIVKFFVQVFASVVLFLISLCYGRSPNTLAFALFSQSMVLVAYNSVITSQYFIWYMSILPLVIHDLKMKPSKAILLGLIWVSSQGMWLYYAYLLEFKSKEVFLMIWVQTVVFFMSNIYLLTELMKSYTPGFGFGMLASKQFKTK